MTPPSPSTPKKRPFTTSPSLTNASAASPDPSPSRRCRRQSWLPLHEAAAAAPDAGPPDASIARSGTTARLREWRDGLLKTGVRGKGGQKIEFTRVEALGGLAWLHADALTKPTNGGKSERAVVSFGPEHGPLKTPRVVVRDDGKVMPREFRSRLYHVYNDPEVKDDLNLAAVRP